MITLIIPLLVSFLSLTQDTNRNICVECSNLLERHTEAMGGKANWAKLKGYTMTYQKESGGVLEIKALMPDKLELKFTREGEVRQKIYDGEHGYILRNGVYEPMRKGEIIEMKEEPVYYSELIFAEDKGYELSYLGFERIDELNCPKISMQKSDVDEHIYWLHPETYLVYMTGEYSEDPAHEGIYYRTRLEDYRPVNGLMFPYKQGLIPNDKAPIVSTASQIKVEFEDLDLQLFEYEPNTTRNLISYWKDRFTNNRLKAFSFVQETIRFLENGQDTGTWYEAVEYPDNFRIVFGEKDSRSTNIYRNDSVYVYRQGKLKRAGRQVQEFMIMEGSVYSNPVDTTMAKLRETGVDPSLFHVCHYQGRKTYVIGAEEGDLGKAQVWLDAERRSTIRRFMMLSDNRLMEVRYSDFKNFGEHDIESWLEFYIDGELIQTERYYDIRIVSGFDPEVFDPSMCLDRYWY